MSKINQPFDLLELDEHSRLKTILQDNYALEHNEYRPLQEFDNAMRMFARDFLRNYLFNKAHSQSKEELEQDIIDFERMVYGTGNSEQIKL